VTVLAVDNCAAQTGANANFGKAGAATIVDPDLLKVGDDGLLELLGLDGNLGDLAQCDDRILVAVAIDREVGAARNLTRTLGREQDQVEPVRDFIYAIFNRNARHSSLRKAILFQECGISGRPAQ